MRKGEAILEALLPVLVAGDASCARNAPLPDLSAAGKVVRLLDGDAAEQTEAFLNPPIYEFTMRPLVQVIVSGGADEDRDAAVDRIVSALLTALATITDLGELITDIRPQPPTSSIKELFGAPNVTAAEFAIELDFWSETSAG